MKKFCYICGEEQDTEVITKEEVSTIRGEKIKSVSHIRVCSLCKEELFDEELDEGNIQRAYDVYRKKYGVLSPEEIRDVREQYGLSQRLFAKLLNIGEASIARYETGALPEKSLSNMIMLLRNPRNMKILLEKNIDELSFKEKNKLIQKIDRLIYGNAEDRDFSGTRTVNIPSELYKAIETKAGSQDKTLEEYVKEILSSGVI